MIPSFSYTIAIRTLGTAGDKFLRELQSIHHQTVKPDRVVVYIAEGYLRPNFTVGSEEYVWVKKGMMAQRLLPYSDITSDCLLMLDDDVLLADDTAERMLMALSQNNADCVGLDTYKNHEMSVCGKVYAAMLNLVFPHCNTKWAFMMHRNGSFSYINRPRKEFYWSHTCAGPAMMLRMETYHKLYPMDELWLDRLGYYYGEDSLLTYKIHKNGFRLGVLFDSGATNLDAGTASGSFRKSPDRMYVRTFASFAIWWRTCYKPSDTSRYEQCLTVLCYAFKAVWLLLVAAIASLFDRHSFKQYIVGMADAWRYVHTAEFKSLRPYVFLR